MIGFLFISIGYYAYWSLPQVVEVNTPQPMDVSGEGLLYYE